MLNSKKDLSKLNGCEKVFCVQVGNMLYFLLSDCRILTKEVRIQSGIEYQDQQYKYFNTLRNKDVENGKEVMRRFAAEKGGEERSVTEKRSSASPAPKGLDWKSIFAEAHLTGITAAENAYLPMYHLLERENPLDDSSPIKTYHGTMQGSCGFAWIIIKPANSEAGKFAKEKYGAKKDDYDGGVRIWIHDFGQSYEQKAAYAAAFAKTLKEYGVKAYANSRLD